MAETKEITRIVVVTDSDNDYEHIGDIDGGGFDKEWLKKHINSHGTTRLLEVIAWMSFQVWEAFREVNAEKDMLEPKQAVNPEDSLANKYPKSDN